MVKIRIMNRFIRYNDFESFKEAYDYGISSEFWYFFDMFKRYCLNYIIHLRLRLDDGKIHHYYYHLVNSYSLIERCSYTENMGDFSYERYGGSYTEISLYKLFYSNNLLESVEIIPYDMHYNKLLFRYMRFNNYIKVSKRIM